MDIYEEFLCLRQSGQKLVIATVRTEKRKEFIHNPGQAYGSGLTYGRHFYGFAEQEDVFPNGIPRHSFGRIHAPTGFDTGANTLPVFGVGSRPAVQSK